MVVKMPWGRLDDSLYDHPKVDAIPPRLRNACVGLWVRAISWSNRFLSDGAVTTERLHKLDGATAHIDALVDVGMFDRTPTGVVVHDFLAFNESADEVRQKRAVMRELGKRGGLASRSSAAVSVLPSQPANTRPVPSLPNRTSPVSSHGTAVKNGGAETFAEKAGTYPDMLAGKVKRP